MFPTVPRLGACLGRAGSPLPAVGAHGVTRPTETVLRPSTRRASQASKLKGITGTFWHTCGGADEPSWRFKPVGEIRVN